MPCTEKWGLTQVKIDKCTYTWTISNFTYLRKKTGEEIESPCFSIGSDETPKWCLKLYLKGINEDFKDYLSLYLYRKSGAEQKFDGQYALSILNSRGEKFAEQREECRYNKNYSSWGFPGFIRNELVEDKANNVALLTDDSLTFVCEVTIVTGVDNVSSDVGAAIHRRHLLPQSEMDAMASRHFEKLFLDKRFSDVRLITGCGRELHAHKNLLAARSPIFSAMFEHDMLESKYNTVDIPDVEHNVLKEMVRFIYAARVENIEGIAGGLLVAADKYEIKGLKEVCEEMLCNSMSVDNVVEILVLADRHSIGYLKARAMNFIKAHIKDVIKSPGFKTLVQADILMDIIRAIVL